MQISANWKLNADQQVLDFKYLVVQIQLLLIIVVIIDYSNNLPSINYGVLVDWFWRFQYVLRRNIKKLTKQHSEGGLQHLNRRHPLTAGWIVRLVINDLMIQTSFETTQSDGNTRWKNLIRRRWFARLNQPELDHGGSRWRGSLKWRTWHSRKENEKEVEVEEEEEEEEEDEEEVVCVCSWRSDGGTHSIISARPMIRWALTRS